MNREELVAIIRYECMASEGFLTRLRGREFSQEHYDRLLNALLAYREVVRGQDWIKREVACCLYYLDLDFRASLALFPRNETKQTLIKDAQLECSNLVLEILTPEYMTDPIPDELLK